jgi:hypothetical protein
VASVIVTGWPSLAEAPLPPAGALSCVLHFPQTTFFPCGSSGSRFWAPHLGQRTIMAEACCESVAGLLGYSGYWAAGLRGLLSNAPEQPMAQQLSNPATLATPAPSNPVTYPKITSTIAITTPAVTSRKNRPTPVTALTLSAGPPAHCLSPCARDFANRNTPPASAAVTPTPM